MAVGLGCFFVLSVRAMQHNLLAEFSAQLGSSSPDLVLIDVQQDQTEGVQAAVAPFVMEPARIMPLMRARVVGVFGARTVLENADAVRQARPADAGVRRYVSRHAAVERAARRGDVLERSRRRPRRRRATTRKCLFLKRFATTPAWKSAIR